MLDPEEMIFMRVHVSHEITTWYRPEINRVLPTGDRFSPSDYSVSSFDYLAEIAIAIPTFFNYEIFAFAVPFVLSQ